MAHASRRPILDGGRLGTVGAAGGSGAGVGAGWAVAVAVMGAALCAVLWSAAAAFTATRKIKKMSQQPMQTALG